MEKDLTNSTEYKKPTLKIQNAVTFNFKTHLLYIIFEHTYLT